jgi:hypothetical protein
MSTWEDIVCDVVYVKPTSAMSLTHDFILPIFLEDYLKR